MVYDDLIFGTSEAPGASEACEPCPRCKENIVLDADCCEGEITCPSCGLKIDLGVDDDGDVTFEFEDEG